MSAAQAYRAVKLALQSGRLIRPDQCGRCGRKDTKAKGGRTIIHAHHRDYSRPLDVEWLCAKCHRAETPLPKIMGAPVFGQKNGQSKLTTNDVAYIRSSNENNVALGKRFGVNNTTIGRVKRGVHWLAAAEGKE